MRGIDGGDGSIPPMPWRRTGSAVLLAVVGAALLASAGCGDHVVARGSARPALYVIGLDGADWRYLDRLIAEGAMPELQRLVREGHRGVLRTEQPPLSPIVWTTMMTGV